MGLLYGHALILLLAFGIGAQLVEGDVRLVEEASGETAY